MRTLLALSLMLLATTATAQSWRPLETIDEARQRHDAERYETYRDRGYQAPLGGYQDSLGDPAPYGTSRPGYVEPQPPQQPHQRRFDSHHRDW